MRAGRASRTAEHNALFRALEAARRVDRRAVHDPLARSFLRWPLAPVARLGALPVARELIPPIIDRRWPGVRTAVVARTRLIDEILADVVTEETEQFVVLGAGYDSRAWRLPALAHLTVFEVDHPDTQRAKMRALPRVMPNVRFVPTDFSEEGLAAAMHAADYREAAPTVMLWEGVTNYLTEEAVDATLRWCTRAAGGSTLVFTYVHRDVLDEPGRFVGGERLFATLAKVGERFTFGLDPGDLSTFLAGRGLALVSDEGANEFRHRCYGAAAERMQGHEFYRVATARVAATAAVAATAD